MYNTSNAIYLSTHDDAEFVDPRFDHSTPLNICIHITAPRITRRSRIGFWRVRRGAVGLKGISVIGEKSLVGREVLPV